MTAVVVAMAAFALVGIFWARRLDRMDALEALDDEALAIKAADAWNRGEW
jgi:hypothetical protein